MKDGGNAGTPVQSSGGNIFLSHPPLLPHTECVTTCSVTAAFPGNFLQQTNVVLLCLNMEDDLLQVCHWAFRNQRSIHGKDNSVSQEVVPGSYLLTDSIQ